MNPTTQQQKLVLYGIYQFDGRSFHKVPCHVRRSIGSYAAESNVSTEDWVKPDIHLLRIACTEIGAVRTSRNGGDLFDAQGIEDTRWCGDCLVTDHFSSDSLRFGIESAARGSPAGIEFLADGQREIEQSF